jgi:hypothetical protein
MKILGIEIGTPTPEPSPRLLDQPISPRCNCANAKIVWNPAYVAPAGHPLTSCPTCESTDRDIFRPIVGRISRCKDGWHEDRIVKRGHLGTS